ncbi:MAG: universal stress protein, partial [Burkholderia sp.]
IRIISSRCFSAMVLDAPQLAAGWFTADLVVVGHRCRSGLSRWWMGAGNTQLLDRVSCSILVACSSSEEQREAALAGSGAA